MNIKNKKQLILFFPNSWVVLAVTVNLTGEFTVPRKRRIDYKSA